jgi:DnaJ family protein C protein 11
MTNSNVINILQSQLPGFFDPAIGEDKMLHIIYNYREQPHEVTISDNEPLRLPKNCE